MTRVSAGRGIGPGWTRERAFACERAALRRSRTPTARPKKNLILEAYAIAPKLGLGLYNEDEAGPFQAIPQPGRSWQRVGKPERIPHEYVRGGTAKLMTLFHPSDGRVYVKGVPSCTNAVLHPWLKSQLKKALARLPKLEHKPSPIDNLRAWERWQAGLQIKFTLPPADELPPLRMLLVLDNLTGHKTPEFVLWLVDHGIMPLYTPLAGSWLNMAESIQNVLKTRALSGAQPQSQLELIQWLEQVAKAWNRHPTPFIWGGRRAIRRNRARQRRHALSGSGAFTHSPLHRSRALGHPLRERSSPSHLTH